MHNFDSVDNPSNWQIHFVQWSGLLFTRVSCGSTIMWLNSSTKNGEDSRKKQISFEARSRVFGQLISKQEVLPNSVPEIERYFSEQLRRFHFVHGPKPHIWLSFETTVGNKTRYRKVSSTESQNSGPGAQVWRRQFLDL